MQKYWLQVMQAEIYRLVSVAKVQGQRVTTHTALAEVGDQAVGLIGENSSHHGKI